MITTNQALGSPGEAALGGLATALQGGVAGEQAKVDEQRFQQNLELQRETLLKQLQFQYQALKSSEQQGAFTRDHQGRLQVLEQNFRGISQDKDISESQRAQESGQEFTGGENQQNRELQRELTEAELAVSVRNNIKDNQARNYATKAGLDVNRAELAARQETENRNSGMNVASEILAGFGKTRVDQLDPWQRQQATEVMASRLMAAGRKDAGLAAISEQEQEAYRQQGAQLLNGFDDYTKTQTVVLKERALNQADAEFSKRKEYWVDQTGEGGGSSPNSKIRYENLIQTQANLMPDISDPWAATGTLGWNYDYIMSKPGLRSAVGMLSDLDIYMLEVQQLAERARLQGEGGVSVLGELQISSAATVNQILHEQGEGFDPRFVSIVRERYSGLTDNIVNDRVGNTAAPNMGSTINDDTTGRK